MWHVKFKNAKALKGLSSSKGVFTDDSVEINWVGPGEERKLICPYCKAPLNLNNLKICEYCDYPTGIFKKR